MKTCGDCKNWRNGYCRANGSCFEIAALAEACIGWFEPKVAPQPQPSCDACCSTIGRVASEVKLLQEELAKTNELMQEGLKAAESYERLYILEHHRRQEAEQEVSRLRERLRIDPGGSDKIDEVERALEFKLKQNECDELRKSAKLTSSELKQLKIRYDKAVVLLVDLYNWLWWRVSPDSNGEHRFSHKEVANAVSKLEPWVIK